MDAIQRLNRALPKGWAFKSLAPRDDGMQFDKWELNVTGPTPSFVTSLFTRGNTPDEAVDTFLAELRRQKVI